MADTKISAMTAASALTGTELVAGVQSGANVKMTTAQIATLADATALVIGTTPITGGTTGRLLYDNAAVVGEALLTYSAAVLQLGAADAASPVAQTSRVQSVVAGTANTAGTDWTQITSLSTGTGVSGSGIIQTGFANLNTNFTATISNASPAVLTAAAHGLVPGSVFQLTTTGTLPTGFSLATNYYVIATGLASGSFQASATAGGAAVITSSGGSGTHTVTTQTSQQNPASTIATWGPSALTGSQTTSLLNLAQTWSTSGTPTALKLNVTDIGSNAASLLMDWQVGGSSKFSVRKDGLITSANGLSAGGSTVACGFLSDGGSGQFGLGGAGAGQVGLRLGSGLVASWSSTSGLGTLDIGLSRASAGVLGVGNGVAADITGTLAAAKLQIGASPAILTGPAAASLQLGAADVDTAPVAQTARTQGTLAGGTSNVAGANWTRIASPGKGTGAGGQHIFQTAPAGSTGTTVNAAATGLTITAPAVNMQPSVVVGNQALATTATDGFLYVPTCAGTPSGVPTTFTGRVALVYDTSAHQFWIYDGAWKQPKTPAGAATVTWQ